MEFCAAEHPIAGVTRMEISVVKKNKSPISLKGYDEEILANEKGHGVGEEAMLREKVESNCQEWDVLKAVGQENRP